MFCSRLLQVRWITGFITPTPSITMKKEVSMIGHQPQHQQLHPHWGLFIPHGLMRKWLKNWIKCKRMIQKKSLIWIVGHLLFGRQMTRGSQRKYHVIQKLEFSLCIQRQHCTLPSAYQPQSQTQQQGRDKSKRITLWSYRIIDFVFKVPLLSFHLDVFVRLFQALINVISNIYSYSAQILYPDRYVLFNVY